MSRESSDEIRSGRVYNGYDYHVQVWVVDGVIQSCGHPARMRPAGVPCCDSYRYAGQPIAGVPDAETFPVATERRA